MNNQPQDTKSLDSISLVTQILCFSITSPLIALRIFARLKLHHSFGVEDASCYLAWILFLGHCICTLLYTFSGVPSSPDTRSNSPSDTRIELKIFYIATMLYVPMILLVKTSLIYTLIRLWSPYRAKVVSLYVFLTIIVAYYIIILFVKVFSCAPIRLLWEVNDLAGSCLNRSAIIIADSVTSVTTDLAILTFPIALTWGLQMAVSKKLHVIVILGAGGTAIAFSIYRLVLAVHYRDASFQRDLFLRILLSDNAEGGLGLICTCIPAINKLISQLKQEYNEKRNLNKREFQVV